MVGERIRQLRELRGFGCARCLQPMTLRGHLGSSGRGQLAATIIEAPSPAPSPQLSQHLHRSQD